MQIQPKRPTAKGPAEWFTGQAWMDAIGEGQGAARMTIGAVHFAPGAHSAWHRHSIGQTLYVISGVGRVQAKGGHKREHGIDRDGRQPALQRLIPTPPGLVPSDPLHNVFRRPVGSCEA